MIFNLTLPAQLFLGVYSNISIELLQKNSAIIIQMFLINICVFSLNYTILKFILKGKIKSATSASLATFTNTLYFGLPICLNLFGDKSIIYILLFYLCNSIPLWLVVGVFFGRENSCRKTKIKNFFSPPLISILSAFAFIALKVEIYIGLKTLLKYLSDVTLALAMLTVGFKLYEYRRFIRIDKRVFITLFLKYTLLPLVVAIYMMILKDSHINWKIMSGVFIIQSILPTPTQFIIIVSNDDTEQLFASKLLILTFLISILAIPIMMFFLNKI